MALANQPCCTCLNSTRYISTPSQYYQTLLRTIMGDLSTLCLACSDVLHPKLDSGPLAQDNALANHHQTLVSFLDAVKMKCFVCRTIYENVNYQQKGLLTKSSVQDASTVVRLRVNADEKDDQLKVRFQWRRGRMLAVTVKFKLLPCSSRYYGDPKSSQIEPLLSESEKLLTSYIRPGDRKPLSISSD